MPQMSLLDRRWCYQWRSALVGVNFQFPDGCGCVQPSRGSLSIGLVPHMKEQGALQCIDGRGLQNCWYGEASLGHFQGPRR